MKVWIYWFFFMTITVSAQSDLEDIRSNFQRVQHMPYICGGPFEAGKFGCGDSLFWQVVRQKDKAIDNLIELLADTTYAQPYFPNYGGLMTIGDIARVALGEIIQPLPQPHDFFTIEEMDGSQWMANIHWLQISYLNRKAYSDYLKRWYAENKSNLVWITSNRFMCGDVAGEHPNKGHFELKKE